MAFVGIERAWSGVRMFTVVPRLVRGALVSGRVGPVSGLRRIDDDSSFNVSKVNDDDDDDHFDRFRS
jgi:hypothetical protein